MAKLKGKAKAAFLRRMKRGRAAAARRRGGTPNPKRKTAKRENPQLLVIGNPHSRSALAAYRKFHGTNPVKVAKAGRGKNPKAMLSMGDVVEIVYEPRRGQRKRAHWVHKFKRRALLLASPDGRELRIIDSAGRVLVDFGRGIIG